MHGLAERIHACITAHIHNIKNLDIHQMKNLSLVFSLLSLLGMASAHAEDVVPVNYFFDQATGSGTWTYSDPNHTKLTDGIVGAKGWAVNQGQEWVGWNNKPVINIDFDFGTTRSITSVSVGSTQDYLGDVVLPTFRLYAYEGSSSVAKGLIVNAPSALNNSAMNDPTAHAFYTFSNLSINSQYLRLTVFSNGPYTFIDEVRFQAAPVPEPETYALLMAGLGLIGAVTRRRKTKPV